MPSPSVPVPPVGASVRLEGPLPEPFTLETNINEPSKLVYTPITDELRCAEIQRVLSNFAAPIPFAEPSTINHNTYNSQTFRVEGIEGDAYCLREARGWRTLERTDILEAMHVVYEFLHRRGIPGPTFVPAGSGMPYVKYGEKQHNWTLSPWIDADHRFMGTEEEIAALGKQLARIHQALRALEEGGGTARDTALHGASANTGYSTVISRQEIDDVFSALEALPADGNPLTARLKAIAEAEKTSIYAALHMVNRDLTPADFADDAQLIHSDLAPMNILVGRDGRITVIDYEKMQRQNVLADIAYAAVLAARQGAEGYGALTAGMRKDQFLEAYHAADPSVDLNQNLIRAFALNRLLTNFKISWGAYAANPADPRRIEVAWQLPGYAIGVREGLEIFR